MSASWYNAYSAVPADAAWFAQPKAFSSDVFQPYRLVAVTEESHNAKRFKFALTNGDTPLNLPIASCITLRYTADNGEEILRPYTPLNLYNNKGFFELVVKCYPNSKMGSHLFGLSVGDTIDVKGPWPTLQVAPNQFHRIGMIAGGTGITPMFQILRNILSVKENATHISLLYANHTQDDILLRKELDAEMRSNPKTFAVQYCLNNAPKNWTGFNGYVDKKMITEVMPGPECKDAMVLVSGPPGFMQAICGPKDFTAYPPRQGVVSGHLKELGYTESNVYKF